MIKMRKIKKNQKIKKIKIKIIQQMRKIIKIKILKNGFVKIVEIQMKIH